MPNENSVGPPVQFNVAVHVYLIQNFIKTVKSTYGLYTSAFTL
jgi:hypothetical protein